MYSVSDETRKPIFEGVQGENEAREIQFDVTAWVEELGEGVCTATAKRPTDTTPYPVTVTRSGNVVTWKPNSTDTSIEGIGAFQLAFSINDVVAKTRIWNTKIAPSLVGAGDPPDPYDDWIEDLREIAADAIQAAQDAEQAVEDAQDEVENAEAWAVGQRGGVDVPSTDPTYHNNAKYYAEQSAANQYGAYIVKSASGDIASFNDGADNVPMKSLNVQIVPKQSGSGDPSPTNVRPISGTSTADVTVAGKNIIGNIAFGNVPSVVSGEIVSAQGWATDFIKIDNSNHICMSVGVNSSSSYLLFYDKQKTYLGYLVMYRETTTPLVSTNFPQYSSAEYVKVRCDNTSSVNPYAQLEVGTTATAYEPYTGTTTPVPLGQTVYVGTVNPISGELKITHRMVDMGSLMWASNATGLFYANIWNAKIGEYGTPADAYCSIYKIASMNNIPNYAIAINNGQSRVNAHDDSYADATAFKTGVTGQTLVYELETPTTVQLTPAQVASLLGTNNVWSDAGSVEVEYRADPTLAYAELQALILENI